MRAIVFITFFAVLSIFANSAFAQKVGESCEQEFWDVLKERSWMEGKREMEVVQTLLLKPDSTLEYSCFHTRMWDELAIVTDTLFSDNVLPTNPNYYKLFKTPQFRPRDLFQPIIIIGAPPNDRNPICIANNTCITPRGPNPVGDMFTVDTLNHIIQAMVLVALETYLDENYDYNLGGGLTGIEAGPCDVMDQVWSELKCENFNERDVDLLAGLRWDAIPGNDPRTLPEPCNEAGRSGNWNEAIQVAFPPPTLPGSAGSVEAVSRTYLPELRAGNCGPPIYTGLVVIDRGLDVGYRDAVCAAPGCYYTRGGCSP